MNYQVLDVKVKDTEEIGKLYTYFLDNSQEIDPNRVRPVIVICPGGGYTMTSDREAEPIAMQYLARGYHAVILRYSVAPGEISTGTSAACEVCRIFKRTCRRISY